MKTIALALLAASATLALAQNPAPKPPSKPGMALTSTSFEDGGIIPNKYTAAAEGAPITPQLAWKDAPEGTVSFVLLVTDPDVTVSKGTDNFSHWTFFNIPAAVHELAENFPDQPKAQLPDGSIQLVNRFKHFGYLAPGAPGPGPYHHYIFNLYALDAKLDLDENAKPADVLAAMQGHVLGRAVLVGRFHRP